MTDDTRTNDTERETGNGDGDVDGDQASDAGRHTAGESASRVSSTTGLVPSRRSPRRRAEVAT